MDGGRAFTFSERRNPFSCFSVLMIQLSNSNHKECIMQARNTAVFFLGFFPLCYVAAVLAEEPLQAAKHDFVEKRFTITQPTELGYIVEAILKTVDRLGIDIKLAAMQFEEPTEKEWVVSYGAATGNHKHQYRYQNETRSNIFLEKQSETQWRDPDFTYSLSAALSFLGIRVSLGPVYAYEADVTFDFQPNEPIHIYGDALLPASEARALDFMTDLKIAKVNALLIAGLRCTEICEKDVCEQNQTRLPKTGLDVIQCNPQVQPIGVKDFGNGPEEYYKLGLEFYADAVPSILEPSQ